MPTTTALLAHRLGGKISPSLLLFAWLFLSPTPASADIVLGFGSLPSAQGWTYVGAAPETSIFGLNAGTLAQNSVGIGGGVAYYRLSAVDITRPFALDFRGRILQEQVFVPLADYGFGVEVDCVTQTFAIGLGTNRIVAFQPSGNTVVTTSVDTSQFHDYRLTGDPADSTWQLYVDGAIVGSGLAYAAGTFPNDLNFGDLTSGANARGEWTGLVFSQAVPEPSSLTLFMLGAVGISAFAGRRTLVGGTASAS